MWEEKYYGLYLQHFVLKITWTGEVNQWYMCGQSSLTSLHNRLFLLNNQLPVTTIPLCTEESQN